MVGEVISWPLTQGLPRASLSINDHMSPLQYRSQTLMIDDKILPGVPDKIS